MRDYLQSFVATAGAMILSDYKNYEKVKNIQLLV